MKLLIGKSGEKDLYIDAQELVTGRTCIIAQSGAGKSWSLAVLCEQMCKSEIGFCLIDTEGEYFSLRDKFPVTWVGSDSSCDEDIETVNIKDLMTSAIRCSTQIIYDVSESDMRSKVTELADVIYEIASELRTPYLLIIEEADKFIPQSRDSIKKIEEISRRGRKRGLGLLVATQRPAIVTKNVLSQCNNQIIGKLSIENDLRAVDLFFGSRKEVEELATLKPGEFFIMGGLAREKVRLRFAMRETKHRGLTPRLRPGGERTPVTAPLPSPRKNPCRDGGEVVEVNTQYIADAVVPVLLREEALEIAQSRRKKKILAMGQEERIVSAELVYSPLISVSAKYIGGRLRKSTKSVSFVISGTTGDCAEISNGLRFSPCFSELIGLDTDCVKIISRMTYAGGTPAELEAATLLSPDAVRRAITRLEEKKLITVSARAGEAKIYVPLLSHKVPKPGQLRAKVNAKMEPFDGITRECTIGEDDVRTLLKGIEPTSEITEYAILYYPVFEIAYISGQDGRVLYLDAVTGKEITLPGC